MGAKYVQYAAHFPTVDFVQRILCKTTCTYYHDIKADKQISFSLSLIREELLFKLLNKDMRLGSNK